MSYSGVITLNIVSAIFRLVASVCFGLLASRWLLAYLGDENFGTLTALGASGVFVYFFTMSLVRGTQREIAFYIGKEDLKTARVVFGSSATLFFAVAGLMLLVMFAARPLILGALSMPAGRMEIVEWVYLVSIGQIAVAVAVAPYRAVLEASQRLAIVSLVESVFSGLNLGMILMLPSLPGDRLLVASLAQASLALLSVVVLLGCSFFYCRSIVYTRFGIKWGSLRNIFSITGWSMFGHLNWILRNEGSVFALNVFFGPVINASYSLALRLNAFQNELAFAVVRALQPALTGAVAAGNHGREKTLTLMGSKLPVLASLFVWIPILFCAEEIFQFWLGRVPEGAPLFLRILGVAMIGMSSYGHQMALESHSKLAGVTLWMTLPPIVAFFLWCGLQQRLGLPFWSLAVSQLGVGMLLVLVVRPWLHGAILGIPWREWFRSVLIPIVGVHLSGFVGGLPAWLFLAPGLPRVVLVTVGSGAAMATVAWSWIFGESERAELKRLLEKIWTKIRPARSS